MIGRCLGYEIDSERFEDVCRTIHPLPHEIKLSASQLDDLNWRARFTAFNYARVTDRTAAIELIVAALRHIQWTVEDNEFQAALREIADINLKDGLSPNEIYWHVARAFGREPNEQT